MGTIKPVCPVCRGPIYNVEVVDQSMKDNWKVNNLYVDCKNCGAELTLTYSLKAIQQEDNHE